MKNFYQESIECANADKLLALQSERLVRQVRHVWDNVPYYRRRMEECGVTPEMIRGAEDLHLLPFLGKEDLRLAYPDGLLAVPRREVQRIHSTSGTTGKRVVAFYTRHDLELWQDCVARALCAAGLSEEDVLQISYGYGLFTGGLGIHGGSERVGCMTVPMSTGSTERQLRFMEDLGVTAICCTPSYAEYLSEAIEENHMRERLKLRVGIFGAEAWSEEMRLGIQRSLGIRAYDIYGLTELSGPGIAYECEEQDGMHINEDHFLAEIIDPDTGEVLPDGAQGELVLTALDKEAFPLLRYRTHDICRLTRGRCSCGRTFVKMCRPMGRSDDMLIIKGVNVFPSQIETVLLEQGYTANYQIVVDRVNHSDTAELQVEMTADSFSDSLAKISAQESSLVSALKEMLGIVIKVRLVAPKSITRSEGKSVRVIDRRKL